MRKGVITVDVILSILMPFYTISIKEEDEDNIKELFDSSSILIQHDLSAQ